MAEKKFGEQTVAGLAHLIGEAITQGEVHFGAIVCRLESGAINWYFDARRLTVVEAAELIEDCTS